METPEAERTPAEKVVDKLARKMRIEPLPLLMTEEESTLKQERQDLAEMLDQITSGINVRRTTRITLTPEQVAEACSDYVQGLTDFVKGDKDIVILDDDDEELQYDVTLVAHGSNNTTPQAMSINGH